MNRLRNLSILLALGLSLGLLGAPTAQADEPAGPVTVDPIAEPLVWEVHASISGYIFESDCGGHGAELQYGYSVTQGGWVPANLAFDLVLSTPRQTIVEPLNSGPGTEGSNPPVAYAVEGLMDITDAGPWTASIVYEGETVATSAQAYVPIMVADNVSTLVFDPVPDPVPVGSGGVDITGTIYYCGVPADGFGFIIPSTPAGVTVSNEQTLPGTGRVGFHVDATDPGTYSLGVRSGGGMGGFDWVSVTFLAPLVVDPPAPTPDSGTEPTPAAETSPTPETTTPGPTPTHRNGLTTKTDPPTPSDFDPLAPATPTAETSAEATDTV
ncbi:MAG: hypothetical protein LBQ92_01570, partial [Propionibacteriaceae bacterium]|nr:hypothetical protein [Propionibacteriaceae bacterium]